MNLSGFAEYIQDLLSDFGVITLRRMFGGYGVYKNDLIIAILADDEIYFKADKSDAAYYEAFDSTRFTYHSLKRKEPTYMAYWKAPLEVLEDMQILEKWVEKAYDASLLKAKAIKQKT